MSSSSRYQRLSLSSATSLIPPDVFSRSERRSKEEEKEGKEVRKSSSSSSSSSSFSTLFSNLALSRAAALRRISTASSSSCPSHLSPGSCQTHSWPYHRRKTDSLFLGKRCPSGLRRSYCSSSAAVGVLGEKGRGGQEGRSRRRIDVLYPSSSSSSRQGADTHRQSEELSDTIRSSRSKASSTSSSVARSLPIALSLCYPPSIPSASSSSVCSSLSSASSSIAAAQSLMAMDSLETAFHRYYRRSSSSSYHRHEQLKSHERGKNDGTRGENSPGGRGRAALAKQRSRREEVEEQQRNQPHGRVNEKEIEKRHQEGCAMIVKKEREMTESQRGGEGSIRGSRYSQKASSRSTEENTQTSLSCSDKNQTIRRGRERERRGEGDGDLNHRREGDVHEGSYSSTPQQMMMMMLCTEERRKALACGREKESKERQGGKECIPVDDGGLEPKTLLSRSRFLTNDRDEQERERRRTRPSNGSSVRTVGGGQITPSFTGEATSVSRPLGSFENFLPFRGKEEEKKKRTGKEEEDGEEKKRKNGTGGESEGGGDDVTKAMITIPFTQDRHGDRLLHVQQRDKTKIQEEACIGSSEIDKRELSIDDEGRRNTCTSEDRKTPTTHPFIDRPDKDLVISFTSHSKQGKEEEGVCLSHQEELRREQHQQPPKQEDPSIKQEKEFFLPVTAVSSSSSSSSSSSGSPHQMNPAVSSFSSSSFSSPLRRPSLLSSPVFRGSSANSAGSSEILFDATAVSPYMMPRRSDQLLEEEEPLHHSSTRNHSSDDASGGVCTLRLYSSEGDRGKAEEAALPPPRSRLQGLDDVKEEERSPLACLQNHQDLGEIHLSHPSAREEDHRCPNSSPHTKRDEFKREEISDLHLKDKTRQQHQHSHRFSSGDPYCPKSDRNGRRDSLSVNIGEEEGDSRDSSKGDKGLFDEEKERRTTGATSNRVMTIEVEEETVEHVSERTRLQGGGVVVAGLDRHQPPVEAVEEREKNRCQANPKLHSSLPNLRDRMQSLHHEGAEERRDEEAEEEQNRYGESRDHRLHCDHLSHHHHRLSRGDSIQRPQERERYNGLLGCSQSSLPSSSSCCFRHCHAFNQTSRRPSLPQLPSDTGDASHQRCYYYHTKDLGAQPQLYGPSSPALVDRRILSSQCPSSLHLRPHPMHRLVTLPNFDPYQQSSFLTSASSSSSSSSSSLPRPANPVIARMPITTGRSSSRSVSKDLFVSGHRHGASSEERQGSEGREKEKKEGGEELDRFFHLSPPRAVPPTAAMLVERQCGQITHPVACRSSDGGGDASLSSSVTPSSSERSP